MLGFCLMTFFTIFGLFANEAWGGTMIQVAVLAWTLYCLVYAREVLHLTLNSGPMIWLMPVVGLLSAVWSVEPIITIRAALQLMTMVMWTIIFVKHVPPRYFLILLFVVLASVSLISVPINHPEVDGETFKINMAGIFENKNTFSTSTAILVITSTVILLDNSIKIWFRGLMVPFIFLGIKQNFAAGSVASSTALLLSIVWAITLFSARIARPRQRKSYISFLVFGGLIGAGVVTFLVVNFSDQMLAMVGKDATLTGRTTLWQMAQDIIDANPLSLGVGYAAFWVQGHSLAENIWLAQKVPSGSGFSFHNLYYEMRMELGLIGVVGSLITIVATLIWVLKWVRGDTTPQSIFFFTLFVFVIIIQTQGVDLFTAYNACYAIFLAMMGYSRSWVQQYEVERRRYVLPLIRVA